jgi:hypothetical protein
MGKKRIAIRTCHSSCGIFENDAIRFSTGKKGKPEQEPKKPRRTGTVESPDPSSFFIQHAQQFVRPYPEEICPVVHDSIETIRSSAIYGL